MEFLFPKDNSGFPPPADILFCDSIAYRLLRRRTKWKNVVPYRLISRMCLEQILAALNG
jgi:hypothetical protein